MKTILFLCFGLLICLVQPTSSEPFVLKTPANGAVNVKPDAGGVVFSWSLGRNQNFYMWISTSLDSIVNGTAYKVDGIGWYDTIVYLGFDLQKGTTYYWQVWGTGEFCSKSQIWSFTTAGTVSVASIPSNIVRPVPVDARYYNVQGKLINKNSSHNIIIRQTGNMISKEVLWNCSRKTSR
jgi:hypothetical protein